MFKFLVVVFTALLFFGCNNGNIENDDDLTAILFGHVGLWAYSDGAKTSSLLLNFDRSFIWQLQYGGTTYNLEGIYHVNLFRDITLFFLPQSASQVNMSTFTTLYRIENERLYLMSFANFQEMGHTRVLLQNP